MSGLPPDPPRPRRPKPRTVPDADAGTGAEGASTFRPNPNRAAKTRADGGLPPDVNPGRGPSWWERILFGRVSSGQLSTFCRQFAAYLHAGVDISKSLASLQKQFSTTALGPVIGRLYAGVRRGDPVTELVAREPQAFDALFVSMVRVAEARGGLPETLRNLGRHYEKRQSLIRQARSAMIYPIAVLLVASLVVGGLTIWILPMFASMIQEMAGPRVVLPLPARILMGISWFVQRGGWILFPVVLIGGPVALLKIYRTPNGKRLLDRTVFVVPVFGTLLKKIDTSRFARTLSALLDAGVDVGASLDLTAEVLQLDPFRAAVRDARTQVIHGTDISTALASTDRFGADVIAVIGSGEETGKLPESLNHLADDYEEQVAHMVRNMGQLVQPLLTVVLGGIVLFIILAFFLTYISLLTNLTAPV